MGKFSPQQPELTKPIRDLLKSEISWTWGQPRQKAFLDTKKELGSETVLTQYRPSKETVVLMGADGEQRPVLISWSLTKTEKEALALTWASEHL